MNIDYQSCRKGIRHDEREILALFRGLSLGNAMWGNDQLLLEARLIGGFEQHSYENWDQTWRVKLHSMAGPVGIECFDPPIEGGGACLICAINGVKKQAEKKRMSAPATTP